MTMEHFKRMCAAEDALEAANKRIAELEKENKKLISNLDVVFQAAEYAAIASKEVLSNSDLVYKILRETFVGLGK